LSARGWPLAATGLSRETPTRRRSRELSPAQSNPQPAGWERR
jgi:hypothetical protein